MTTTENEVAGRFQSLERKYWIAFDTGSTKTLESIIHEQKFLGCTSDGTDLSRDGLIEKVTANKDRPRPPPTIELLKHIVIDDTAITLVSRCHGVDKKVVTHTWIRDDDQWIMIGGMSQKL